MAIPSTPGSLSIDIIASNCLKLSWADVGSEDGYKLYRSTDGSKYNVLADLDANTVVYWDHMVAASTGYYYKISAYNLDGESALSSAVYATTLSESRKKYWRGPVGPFYYDENAIHKEENVALRGFRTEGRMRVETAPSVSEDVVRKADSGGVFAPHDAQYVVVSLDGTLTSERRLVGGTNISLSDGGDNGDLSINNDLVDWENTPSGKYLDLTAGAYFKPRRVRQSSRPTPEAGELLIWSDSDDDSVYLVYNDSDAGVVQASFVV